MNKSSEQVSAAVFTIMSYWHVSSSFHGRRCILMPRYARAPYDQWLTQTFHPHETCLGFELKSTISIVHIVYCRIFLCFFSFSRPYCRLSTTPHESTIRVFHGSELGLLSTHVDSFALIAGGFTDRREILVHAKNNATHPICQLLRSHVAP